MLQPFNRFRIEGNDVTHRNSKVVYIGLIASTLRSIFVALLVFSIPHECIMTKKKHGMMHINQTSKMCSVIIT